MPPPPGAIAAVSSPPTALNGEPLPPLGALAITADANAEPALPAQLASQPKPGPKDTPERNASATQPASDEVDIDPDAPLPGTPAKKPPTAGPDPKPIAAGDAKPAAAQPATTGGNTAPMIVATASPDAALPLPIADGSAPVKTVPLSNLANLPPGAAVTAIGAVIVSEAAAGTNRFVIRLDPPELGRIDVRLRFGKDGEVHTRMIADRPETASMLMRDAAALERALNASGLRTADAGIDVMLRDSSGGFARTDGGFGGDAPPSSPYAAPTGALESMSEAPVWIRPASSGRLDLTV
jgi:flagellar hook-length control protein FliK